MIHLEKVLLLFVVGNLLTYMIFYPRPKKNGTSSSEAFSKGDVVTAFGNKGIVKSITANGLFVEVQFEGAPNTTLFELDGKYMKWNKRSSLVKL